ncbi:MAG: BLUF domain-containing protein [Labrys sp. (in: a-proteobacteria)]
MGTSVVVVGPLAVANALIKRLTEYGLQGAQACDAEALEALRFRESPKVIVITERTRDAATALRARIEAGLGVVRPVFMWSARPTIEDFSGGVRPFDMVFDGWSRPALLVRRIRQVTIPASHPAPADMTASGPDIHEQKGSSAGSDLGADSRRFDLVSLVYVSRSLIQSGDADETRELRKILMVSRTHNRNLDITGGLVRIEGFFVQVLEGSSDLVEALMDIIRIDSRHEQVIVREVIPIKRRMFAGWAMACADVRPEDQGEPVVLPVFRPDQASPADLRALVHAAVAMHHRHAHKLEATLDILRGKTCVPL